LAPTGSDRVSGFRVDRNQVGRCLRLDFQSGRVLMRSQWWIPLLFLVVTAQPTLAWPEEPVREWAKLPPNTWTLIHKEGPDGGKAFAQAVLAEDCDRIYLWGTGGKMRNRSTYDRFDLESLSLTASEPKWVEALPQSKQQAWADGN